MPEKSKVMQFITLVWENATKGVPFSYERINHTMQRAMSVALGAFEFELDDYGDICRGDFRVGYWLDCERAYTSAVVNGNTSAVLSIEKHLGREPIIADDVDPPDYWQDRNTHLVGTRQRERLHVGARLMWKGELVTVTSMGQDSATACSYKTTMEAQICPTCRHCRFGEKTKVLHRYTITREAVIANRADRKRRKEIWDRLAAARENDSDGVIDSLKAIGVATVADFDKAPLKKLEKVLAKFQSKKV